MGWSGGRHTASVALDDTRLRSGDCCCRYRILAIMSGRMNALTNVRYRMSGRGLATKTLGRALCVWIAGRAVALLPLATLGQASKSVVWADVDVTLTLREDSSFHITERNRIDFTGGPFRRGYREIPLTRVEDIDNIKVGELVGGQVEPYRQVS